MWLINALQGRSFLPVPAIHALAVANGPRFFVICSFKRTLVACATALVVGLVGLIGNANAQFPRLTPTRINLIKFAASPPLRRPYKFGS